MTYPARLLACSIGKESPYGVAVNPTYSIPLSTCAPTDLHTPFGDAAWRGAPVTTYSHTPGQLSGVLQLGGPVYADTIGFALAGMLGDLTTTTGTPNTHAIALANTGQQQPPSYTIYSADGLNCLAWTGCKFADLTITSSGDGVLAWTGSALSVGSSIVTAPTPQFSGIAQIAGWRGAVKLGGGADGHLLSTSITISRPVTPQRNTDGARVAYNYRSEEVTVVGALTLAMSSDTYRQQYLAGTSTSLDITYSRGTGAALQQVQMHASTITFVDPTKRSYSGDWVELDLSFVADANTTDAGASGGYSPLKATLKNTVASGVYA